MTIRVKILEQSVAKKRLDKDKSIILLDVRDKEDYNKKRIPNSINIPLDEMTDAIVLECLANKNTTIYIYCDTGTASRIVYRRLYIMGYKNIYSIGGIDTWDYETVGESGNK